MPIKSCLKIVVGQLKGLAHKPKPIINIQSLLIIKKLQEALRDKCMAGYTSKQTDKTLYPPNIPLAVWAGAAKDPRYIELQIIDFIKRLNGVLGKKVPGYDITVGEVFQTSLGQATVLDQDINRPGYTARDIAKSLASFPSPKTWNLDKNLRNQMEQKVLDKYGVTREMTGHGTPRAVAPQRYAALKKALPIQGD